ncbi:hypothetical protein [Frankia sp. AgW1.1]|uniref:hypothetical protein n=1 Tax=Frankia sp. AgW1.1 TaxID=1836971 RepID=UPI0019346D74|nr:hypothetical protein [Frankia sp. AgW1.1]MBL7487094.1 hypothetical protein [Frankia sp. AgW1.1]
MSTDTFGDLRDLFGAKLSPDQVNRQAVAYKMAFDKSSEATRRGEVGVDIATKTLTKTTRGTAKDVLTKAYGDMGVDAGQMAAIEAAVASQLGTDFLGKDLTPTSPVSTGLVPYDLKPAALMLAPILTPWRNKFPRTQGHGSSYQYKRITGISGSGTGGQGTLHPGFSDGMQGNFANPGSANALNLNRPRKISYTGDEYNLPYVQFGLSSEQSWFTYFTAMGFQDTRELDRSSTLYASMLSEERLHLYGRGTRGGYGGALAAPTGTPTGAARTAAAGETALTGFTTNVYVKIVAENGEFGVSKSGSASAGIAVSSGQVVDITIPNSVVGATGYQVFVSTGASDPGDASRYWYAGPAFPNGLSAGRTSTQTVTLQGALPTTGNTVAAYVANDGTTVNLASVDGQSGVAASYDGVIPWIHSVASTTGYVGRMNAPFSGSSPGAEFQAAFNQTYINTKANPEEIWLAGQDLAQLSNTLKGQSSSNYRFEITENMLSGATIGAVVNGIVNQTTGRTVSITVHPWMPQGNAVILQNSVTVQGVNVPNCWEVRGPQDYMAIDWPVIAMSYDTSVYWTGTLAAYAPDRSSMLVGIQPAN